MTREPTWERYQGRVIDEIYKQIHKKCENYCSSSRLANFDLYNHLLTNQEALLAKAKRKHADKLQQIESFLTDSQIQQFDKGLRKLIRFEAKITSAFINFEISRLESSNPRRLFSEYFDFNTDLPLTARKQGFTDPASPDFVYRHKIIGDIKFGKWQSFFEYTVLAYALAYEAHTEDKMDYGAILPVELPSNRPVPTHYQVGIIYLGDKLRKRFIALRDRKLQIVEEKRDPGIPEKKSYCDQKCPFLSHCWGTTNG
jgi:CRISPR/Cas system-associated exonuclease Cas4 (RecB family)